MNQRYIDYAFYNRWANHRLITDLQAHDDSIFSKEIISSFPSIRSTLLHIWYAETGWLARLQGKGWEVTKVIEFTGTHQELCNEWSKTSQNLKDFTTSEDLEKLVSFEHKGESFTIPSREIIHTVFTHGSYHRGQVVMMMRQQGVNTITQTDYIEWVREKARGNI